MDLRHVRLTPLWWLVSATVRNRLPTTVVRGKVAVSMGKLQKLVFTKVSQEEVVMPFCVASAVLCGIPCVSEGMCAHKRREGKVALSMGEAAGS